jgi:carbon monoxide dehydrogenase subunit G
MAFEVEVPVRHRTLWLAFTDPEKMARAVPGLTVDAVHPVPPADGPEGVAGDVVAGRLKLRVGAAGGTGAAITYRGTACIAGAEAHKGTLDIAIDAAQARGNGALAGYLRVTLTPAGEAGERTLVSVVPELELSGRALEFERRDWHDAVEALGAAWVEALAAEFRTAEADEDSAADTSAEPTPEPTPEAVPEPAAEPAKESPDSDSESDSEKIANPPIPTVSTPLDGAFSEDPLAAVWNGRYEKNRWFPLITALALFLLIKRRRRHRADNQGADSSFRME